MRYSFAQNCAFLPVKAYNDAVKDLDQEGKRAVPRFVGRMAVAWSHCTATTNLPANWKFKTLEVEEDFEICQVYVGHHHRLIFLARDQCPEYHLLHTWRKQSDNDRRQVERGCRLGRALYEALTQAETE